MSENMVMGGESSRRVVAKTMKTQRRVNELQEEAGSLAGRDHSIRRQKVGDVIGSLLCEQSLARWPLFLEKMCADDAVVGEDFVFVSRMIV